MDRHHNSSITPRTTQCKHNTQYTCTTTLNTNKRGNLLLPRTFHFSSSHSILGLGCTTVPLPNDLSLSRTWRACKHLATTDIGRKLGAMPIWGGGLGRHLTQCRLGWGLPPYQVPPWSIQPFCHNRHGPKKNGAMPLWGRGAWSPSNTMSPGTRPTSIPSGILIHTWPQWTWAENWEGLCPIFVRGAGSPSNTMWLGPRLISVSTFILIHPTVWPQDTNITESQIQTDRTGHDRQTTVR